MIETFRAGDMVIHYAKGGKFEEELHKAILKEANDKGCGIKEQIENTDIPTYAPTLTLEKLKRVSKEIFWGDKD